MAYGIRSWFASLLLVGIFLTLSCGAPGADWETNQRIKREAAGLLKKKDYRALDEMAASIRQKGYRITDLSPELGAYYGAFGVRSERSEAQWQARREELEAWVAAQPDSVAAKTALGDWWIGYGWKARGTGYAYTVTDEGWKLLRERLKKAKEVLRQVPFEQVNDPEYFRVCMVVGLGQSWPVARTRRYLNYGTGIAKPYYPLYSSYAYYLLPKWHGEKGDWEAFAREAADSFPGNDGDFLYAALVKGMSGDYGDELFAKCDLDYPRLKKAYLAQIEAQKDEDVWRLRNDLCYLAAIQGDDELASRLFLEIRGHHYSGNFGGPDDFLRLRAKTGAQALIDQAYALEKAGDLKAAESAFAKFAPPSETNAWLRYFYLRQGMEANVRKIKTRYDLDADPATASPDVLADLCRVAPLLGQWEKAEAAATAFDKKRPWNLTGKTTLLLCAAHRGDRKTAEALRKAILDTKSDRPAFQTVQAVLRGDKTWDEAWEVFKGKDPYNKQSAVAVGIYFLAAGENKRARTAFEQTLALNEKEEQMVVLLESLLYGSLAPLLNAEAI